MPADPTQTSNEAETDPRRRTAWGTILAIWSIPAAIDLAGRLLGADGGQVLGARDVLAGVLLWLPWALVTPTALRHAERWPIRPPDRWRHTLRHLLVGIGFGVVYVTLLVAVEPWLPMQGEPSGRAFAQRFVRTLASGILPCLMIYGLLVAAGHGVALRRRFRRARARAEALRARSAELEQQLAQAQLHALRSQLQPHFLFNTLNAISALIDDDPEQARTMIVRLSDLLRAALDQDGRHEAPLTDEIALLERYLDIERVRLGSRLAVRYRVQEAALEVPVPSLLLQPLVENAVRHGIAPLARPGTIEIEAQVDDDRLLLVVRDDGRGYEAGSAPEGIGLANTRNRLAQRFGARARLTIEARSPSGTEVRIEMPAERHRTETEGTAPRSATRTGEPA